MARKVFRRSERRSWVAPTSRVRVIVTAILPERHPAVLLVAPTVAVTVLVGMAYFSENPIRWVERRWAGAWGRRWCPVSDAEVADR